MSRQTSRVTKQIRLPEGAIDLEAVWRKVSLDLIEQRLAWATAIGKELKKVHKKLMRR